MAVADCDCTGLALVSQRVDDFGYIRRPLPVYDDRLDLVHVNLSQVSVTL